MDERVEIIEDIELRMGEGDFIGDVKFLMKKN